MLVGAGGLGLNAIKVLLALGHKNIISVDISEEKRATAATAGSDEEAYQAALAKLRAKDYAGATAALVAFAKRYPESALRDNAAYWLGEAHYVDGHYAEALEAFQAVVTQFPDSRKRSDALLKAGYCQVELRQWAGARKSLRRVVNEFPGTPAAKEAAARLATFDGSKAR